MNRSLKPYLSLGVILAGLCSIVQTGLAGPQESDLKITLSVHNYAPIESETLIRVEQEVTRIYRKIGVKTVDIVLIIVVHPMTELGAQSDSLGLTPGAGSKRDLA